MRCSQSGGYEDCRLLGYDAVQSVESPEEHIAQVFRIEEAEQGSSSVKTRDKQSHVFTLVSFSAYSSTLKIEAICFSETSTNFQPNTWRYIQEDGALRQAVGIAAGYKLDGRGFGVRIPVGSRNITSPCRPHRLWGPSLILNGYREIFPRGGKAAGE
jgi:hypothetical protein